MHVDNLIEYLEATDKPFQLVKHMADVPAAKRSVYPMWAEVKYDGVFCAVIMGGDMPRPYSRTGKPFFAALANVILPHTPPDNGSEYVLLCELINGECSLEVLSGLVNPNRVNPWTAAEEQIMRHCDLVVHDMLSYIEVYTGFSARSHDARRRHMNNTLPKRVWIADGTTVYNEEDIAAYAALMIDAGHEGIVIKQDMAWIAGHKGYRAMKIVRGLHVDLKCLAVTCGKGKRDGQIARLQFMYKGKLFWADLGKGWTDEKRIRLTQDWDYAVGEAQWHHSPVGKIFHLSALQESSKGVLRLPKVNELRIDKFEEDVT